jgi:hypothetical protein
MLRSHRRYFFLLAFALLAAPLVVGFAWPDSPELVYAEGRRLAPAPGLPETADGLAALPGEIDAWLSDRFGLRHAMIKLHRDLSHPVVLKVNTAALVGRDGRMFYEADDMVRQSAGLTVRDQRVADAADLMAEMRDALKRRGIRFLVAVPPNASTIYQDALPRWAQRQGRRTEYDLLFDALAARRVKAIDLRPALLAARDEGGAYLQHDTHWSALGALAGFNAVVAADGHPDWRIDPSAAIGPPTLIKGGDIARILGVEDEVSETAESFVLPTRGTDRALAPPPMPDHVVTTGGDGPTVMVIGDSFTASYFPAMLSPHVGKAIWINHQNCAFDWSVIDAFRPDEVWWMPTERYLVCALGARPASFAG